MRCHLINLVAVLLLSLSSPLMALNSDREQPIYIESDELEVDDLRGVSEYRGSVNFTQGSIQFQADKIIVFEKERRLHKVVAHGGPVHLRQQLEAEKGEMRAVARKMEYLASSDRLFLHGDARLWQGGNEFSGDQIEYHLKSETVVARSDEKQDSRVHIVIQPKTDKSETESKGTGQP